MYWIHPTKARWYRVVVERDLFGDLVLIRLWGGLGARRLGKKVELVSFDTLAKRMAKISSRRKQHGYQLCPL
jgi:hypothetical protein